MKGALFYIGRFLQLAGMATVLMSLVTYLPSDNTGPMLKVAFIGVIEFYAGYLLVMGTGVK